MLTRLTPKTLPPPFARYSHGVRVPAGAELVFCSGQLGIGTDGAVPPDARGQATLCFAAIAAILAEAGFGLADLVRLNAFVTGREHIGGYMAARDAALAGIEPPASTLVIVSGFTRPEFLVEVEAVAARLS